MSVANKNSPSTIKNEAAAFGPGVAAAATLRALVPNRRVLLTTEDRERAGSLGETP